MELEVRGWSLACLEKDPPIPAHRSWLSARRRKGRSSPSIFITFASRKLKGSHLRLFYHHVFYHSMSPQKNPKRQALTLCWFVKGESTPSSEGPKLLWVNKPLNSKNTKIMVANSLSTMVRMTPAKMTVAAETMHRMSPRDRPKKRAKLFSGNNGTICWT